MGECSLLSKIWTEYHKCGVFSQECQSYTFLKAALTLQFLSKTMRKYSFDKQSSLTIWSFYVWFKWLDFIISIFGNSNISEKSHECNYFNTDATSCAVTVRKPICLLVVFNLAGDWGRRGDRRDAHPFCYWWWWWKTWRSPRSALLAAAHFVAGDYVHAYYENRLEEEEICSSTFCCWLSFRPVARLPTGRWKVNSSLASLH